MNTTNQLKSSQIETPLGPMFAIADDRVLYFLEFTDCRGFDREIEKLKQNTSAHIVPGQTEPIRSVKKELGLYFSGKLARFKTPLHFFGTPFQQSVWKALSEIPYGETRSYADVAISIGRPTAHRAVANANGRNQLAIVVPCHRVINSNGDLGGYGGRVERKQCLLDHETRLAQR